MPMGNAFCCSCSPCEEQNAISRDIILALEKTQSMDDVERLIVYIDQLLSNIETGAQGQINKPPSVASSISSGGNLIDKLSRRLNWHVCKRNFLSVLDHQALKVVGEGLNQPIPFLGMALSVIAHLLERLQQVSTNKEHFARLLRSICNLAKQMKILDMHLPRPELDNILCTIVKGLLMCALQMRRNCICRFISAFPDAADLNTLESQIRDSYQNLLLQTSTQILDRQAEDSQQLTEVLARVPEVPGPSQGEYPHDAVGVEDAQNKVIKLLDLQNPSCRVVVIYGLGGIGKTTLATAVFNRLDLTGYNHCRVFMDQYCKDSDLINIQEQILNDAFKEKLKLRNCIEGREKLSKAFGKASKPVFLFIDNGLRQTDLEKLLPIQHLSGLSMQSKILLTTRNLNEANIFHLAHGIQVYSHRVDSLSNAEAKRVLCHYALGDKDANFDRRVDVDSLMQVCGGIPLVLRIVGAHLRTDGNTLSAFNEIFEYHKKWQQSGYEGGEVDISDAMVDFVYRRLKEQSKEVFLDIACFPDTKRSFVADMFGEMELRDVERAALVTSEERLLGSLFVKVHDIVRAQGRKLSKCYRITDRESLSIALRDPQKLQQIKGIMLEESLEAKQVDLMSSCLRILWLERGSNIYGRCERAFENLRVLQISFEDMLPIDLSKSRQLNFFRGYLMKGDTISEAKLTINLPESLRVLGLFGDSPVSIDIDGRLISLTQLHLKNITFENFETSVTHGSFSCLRDLRLRGSKMERLPDNFGQLKCLKFLDISDWEKLKSLPHDIVCCTSLAAVKATGCGELEGKAMDTLLEINSLLFLEMEDSPMLIKGWKEIQQHRPLIGAAPDFPYFSYSYEEIMSAMFFNGGSRFVHVDGEGQLAEVSWFPEAGAKVGLVLTACAPSEVRQKLLEVASKGYETVYVDVGVEGEAEGERERRIRETLLQLPEGSRVWTSSFRKTTLLFAFSLWHYTGHVVDDLNPLKHAADTSIVGTRVVVDEEGRRKLSEEEEMVASLVEWTSPLSSPLFRKHGSGYVTLRGGRRCLVE